MSQDLIKFDPLKSEVTALVAPTLKLKATDPASAQSVTEARNQVYALLKKLNAVRDSLVRPLNEQVDAINAYAKQIKGVLDQSDQHLALELKNFAIQQEEVRQSALRKAEAERKEKERLARDEADRIAAEQEKERQAAIAAAQKEAEEAEELFGTKTDLEAQQREIEAQAEARRIETQTRLDREASQREAQAKQAKFDANQQQLKNVRKTWKVRVINLSVVPKEYCIIELNEKMALAARATNPNIPGLEFYQEISVARGANTYVPRALK